MKTTDYLQIYEKFKDTKEIKDYIDDVLELRHYYVTQQFTQMQNHIQKLMSKYFAETLVWNAVNTSQPITIEQSYINAENFLQMQGAIILTRNVKNFTQLLSEDEVAFVETMIKRGE